MAVHSHTDLNGKEGGKNSKHMIKNTKHQGDNRI